MACMHAWHACMHGMACMMHDGMHGMHDTFLWNKNFLVEHWYKVCSTNKYKHRDTNKDNMPTKYKYLCEGYVLRSFHE